MIILPLAKYTHWSNYRFDFRVAIGVRFVKENRTIYLQIKQAKLLPMGLIENTSMSWVNLPQISIHNWIDKPKFHKLSYESRSLDLDDLMAPSGYVITGKHLSRRLARRCCSLMKGSLWSIEPTNYCIFAGVRMRTIGSHLNLEVRVTAFEFNSGKLFQNLTYWKSNDNTDVVGNSPRFVYFLKFSPITRGQ